MLAAENPQHKRLDPAFISPKELYMLRRLPARLSAEQTAALLGFRQEHVPILIKRKLLIPLGNPKSNAPKFFATTHVRACSSNLDWLEAASAAMSAHWEEKNRKAATNAQAQVR